MSAGGNFPIEFRLRVMGDQEVIAKIRAVGTAVGGLGGQAAGSASNLNAIKPAVSGVGQAAGQAAPNVRDLGSGFSVVDGATSSAKSSLGQIVPALRGVGENSGAAGVGMERFSSRAAQSATASERSKSAVQGLGNQMRNSASAFSAGLVPMASLSAETGRTAGAMERSGQSARKTTQDYVAFGGRIGGVALSATLMFNALDEANGMQDALRYSQQRAAEAQQQYNQAVKDFGPKSHEATQALQKLEKANIALQFQQRNTGFAVRDIIPIMGLMVTQAIEPAIKGISKLAPHLRNLRGGFSGIKPAAMELTGALSGLTVGAGGVGALTGISNALGGLAGKFGGVATAIGPFLGSLRLLGPVAVVALAALIALTAGIGSVQSMMSAAAGKTEQSIKEFKGSFDLLKLLPGGQFATMLGFAGLDQQLEKATGGTKKAGTAIKSMGQDFVAGGMQTATGANFTKSSADTILLSAKDVEKAAKLIAGADFQPRINMATIQEGLKKIPPTAQEGKQRLAEVKALMEDVGVAAVMNLTPGVSAADGALRALSDTMSNFASTANMDAGAIDLLAQAMLNLTNSPAVLAKGMAEIKMAFAESSIELAKWQKAQQTSAVGAQVVSTAFNDIAAAAIQESFALQGSINAATDAGHQFQMLSNATLAGKESIATWAAGLDDAKAQQDAMVQALGGVNQAFAQLPAGIAPTIDNVKAMHEAFALGGQALFDYKVNAMDAFTSISSSASQFVTDLATAMRTPTKTVEPVKIDTQKMLQDMSSAKYAAQGFVTTMVGMGKGQTTAVQDLFAGLSPAVRASFSQAEQAAAIGVANMSNAFQDLETTFAIDQTFGAGFQQAAMTMSQGLTQMAQSARTQGGAFNESWAQVWDKAAQIAQQAGSIGGSTGQQMMTNLRTAISTGIASGSPASVVLDSLNTIPGAAGQVGTDAGTQLPSRFTESVKQNRANALQLLELQNLATQVGTTGMNAGLSFANAFSAGAVHVATVLTGITNNVALAASAIHTSITNAFSGLTNKTLAITITANTVGATTNLNHVYQILNLLTNRNITVAANTIDAATKLNHVYQASLFLVDKNITVTATVTQAAEKLQWIIDLLAKIVSKSVTVTINQVTKASGGMPSASAGVTLRPTSPTGPGSGALPPGVGSVGGRQHGFGPTIVRQPTHMLVGEAGDELVYVKPMRSGTQAGSPLGNPIMGGDDINLRQELKELSALVKALMMASRSTEINSRATLNVDGHKMADVSDRNMADRAYGDRY
jgi:hypothetical protein